MRFHKFLLIAGLITTLGACGGGNSEPGAVPSGSASGTVLDGLILNGTVTAYDFSTGSKGAVLGTATTNSSTGAYSLPLQVESRPILLEITGGYYTEEAAPQTTNTVTLDSTDNLTALINYTTGQTVTVSVTAFTHLAAGLAEYEIKTGVPVATAINDANQRVSQIAGLDIIHTTPVEVTDISNASANPTPSIEYGFLAAGISQWVFSHTPVGGAAGTQPYTSIKFDQLMHDDVAADGLLDGQGLASGVQVPLSFGTTALSPVVYRQGIGVSMLTFASGTNNKTGLTAGNSASFLSWAEAYAGSTDQMFASVAPVPITIPAVTITSPAASAWLRAQDTVSASLQDYSGLASASLSVDGGTPQTLTTNLTSPSWSIDTTTLADGPHTLVVSATNVVGLTSSAMVTFNVDNTPPVLDLTGAGTVGLISGASVGGATADYIQCTVSGVVSDSGSGATGSVGIQWQWYQSSSYVSDSTSQPLVNGTFTAGVSPVDIPLDILVVLDAPNPSTLASTAPITASTPINFTVTDAAGNTATYAHNLVVTGSNCSPTTNGVGCAQYSCGIN